MTKINRGMATDQDIENMTLLCKVMQKACLCGLGQAAPGPITTTLQHFRHEYERKLLA